MRFTLALLIQGICFLTNGQNQVLRQIREVQLPIEPIKISVDRLGAGYLLGNDRMIKLNENGDPQTERPISLKETVLVETWNPLRIWVYQKINEKHQIQLIDQHLMNAEEPFTPDPSYAINPLLIAPGTNNFTYWILDADRSLKLINIQTKSVDLDTDPIKEISRTDITNMRAYQGFIFLLDSEGVIYMINRTGKLVRRITTEGAKFFGVLGEDIYFHKDSRLLFENIYKESKYEVRLPFTPDHLIATDEQLMLIRGKSMTVFQFQPQK